MVYIIPSLTTLILLLWTPTGTSGIAACSGLPQSVTWREDATGELVHGNKNPNDTVSFDINGQTRLGQQFYSQLKAYFNLTVEATRFSLSVNQALDLEKLYREWDKAILDTVVITMHCSPVDFEIQIANTAVNEFDPTFINAPYTTSISELTPNGTVVFNLTSMATDEDIPKNALYFEIQPYSNPNVDGKDLFDLPGGTGIVTLKKKIDYDTLTQNKYYSLTITVKDQADTSARTATTSLTITILDADDQVPEFVVPGCVSPCVVPPYNAIIGVSETGPVIVTPPIVAVDRDTLNTPLVYKIHSGNDHQLFAINSATGELTQLTSVRQSGLPDKEFRLVIQVEKQNKPVLSALAILTVKIRERMPNFNGTVPDNPDEPEEPAEKDNSLLIPLIILGVLLFIIIIVVIIILLCIRRKQKQTIIRPEDAKSEPQTEEEILPTDREDARSRDKLVSSISTGALIFKDPPSARSGKLAPLPSRDFSTETESMTPRKKPRRRKKKRDPEIFDGTKEYNMGADPEFFEDPDKSRIKRSTRSYSKDRDSQLRLQVPNDDPPEYTYK